MCLCNSQLKFVCTFLIFLKFNILDKYVMTVQLEFIYVLKKKKF